MIGIDRTIRLGERSRGISIVNFVTLKNEFLSFWGSANLHVYGNSYAVSRFCPSVCDEQAYQDRFRRILRRILMISFKPTSFDQDHPWFIYSSNLSSHRCHSGSLNQSGFGLNDRLLSYRFRPVGLIFSLHREIVSICSFLCQFLNLRLGSRSLISRSNSQIVSVGAPLVNFQPLQTIKSSGKDGRKNSHTSPTDCGPFKGSHPLLNFFELLCGGWCCWRGIYLMGFLGRRGLWGFWLTSIGFVLSVHGCFSLLLTAIKLYNKNH